MDPRADTIRRPSDHPDFTQELPRKLLPTRTKEPKAAYVRTANLRGVRAKRTPNRRSPSAVALMFKRLARRAATTGGIVDQRRAAMGGKRHEAISSLQRVMHA
jgi:hypothetical protein